ncbi:MAG: class I SAM-dependent methyltransferase [Oscillospiraceae bacterium]
MDKAVLAQNKASWDAIADDWFGTTALPVYGCGVPTEDDLHLLGDLRGKRVLDIGCGSGHSLLWCARQGAAELFGVDLSEKQIANAQGLLDGNGMRCKLFCQPMESSENLPICYFDTIISVYAIGWTTDLARTFANVASYLKPGGIFVFSWDHPLMHCVDTTDGQVLFSGNYLDEDLFTFQKGGMPVTLRNKKLSTYVNALADAGFAVERVVEESDPAQLAQACFSSGYYNRYKGEKFPLSVIIKARKL